MEHYTIVRMSNINAITQCSVLDAVTRMTLASRMLAPAKRIDAVRRQEREGRG